MKKYFFIGILLITTVVFAQYNLWQRFQPFNRNSANKGLPQKQNLTFNAALINNTTVSKGSSGSFARASSEYYATGSATLTTAASGNPAQPAYIFGGNGAGPGIQIQGARTNKIPDSDDLSQASWTTVGTLGVLVYAGTGSPDPAVTNSTQLTSGGSNAGRDRDSGILAASNVFIGSFYVKSTFGGNITCDITIEGSGATPETSTQAFTATGTWQRKSLAKTFTSAATGNAHLKIRITSNGNSILVMGAQLEQVNDATNPLAHNDGPTALIRTSGGAASTVADNLNFPAGNVNTPLGTVTVWVCPSFDNTQVVAGAAAEILSMGGATFGIDLTNGNFRDNYNGAQLNSTTSWFAGSCFNIAWTFDDANNIRQFYKNGSFISQSLTAVTAPGAVTFNIGNTPTLTANTAFDGQISNLHIWNVVLGAADIMAVFSAERGGYGI